MQLGSIEDNTNLNHGPVTAANDQDSSDTSTPILPMSAEVNRKGKGKDPELYDLDDHTADNSSPDPDMNLETDVTNARLNLHSTPSDIPTIEGGHPSLQYSHLDSEDEGDPPMVNFTVSCCHGNLVPASAPEGDAVFELLSARERSVRFNSLLSIAGVGERRCRICEGATNLELGKRYNEGYERLGYEGFEREDTIELADDDEQRKTASFNIFVQTLLQADWTTPPPQQSLVTTAPTKTPVPSSRAATVPAPPPPPSTTQEEEAPTQRPSVAAPQQRPVLASDHVDLTESISSSSSSFASPPALRRSQRNAAATKNPSPLKQVQNASSLVQQPTRSEQQKPPLVTRQWGHSGEGNIMDNVLAYMNASREKLAQRRRRRKGGRKGTILSCFFIMWSFLAFCFCFLGELFSFFPKKLDVGTSFLTRSNPP